MLAKEQLKLKVFATLYVKEVRSYAK